jgi:hypothetical protein
MQLELGLKNKYGVEIPQERRKNNAAQCDTGRSGSFFS